MNDPVLAWNDIALEVQRRDFTVGSLGDSSALGDLQPEHGGPTRTSRALAMVHIATYEAVALTDPGAALQRYAALSGVSVPPPPAGLAIPPGNAQDLATFVAGAVGGAACTVLRRLWTKQIAFIDAESAKMKQGLQGQYADYGWRIGVSVATEMLNVRQSTAADGYYVDRSNLPEDTHFALAHGKHKPDPFSSGQGRLGTHWGSVTPFCIAPAPAGMSIHDGRISDHPPLATPRYDDAVLDVKALGSSANSTRVVDETVAGLFWGYDGPRGLGVPPRLYNQVVRAFAQAAGGATTAEYVRLLALVNAGMADAAIVAWSAKYHYDLWRPVVGIREHDAGFGAGNGSHAVNLPNPGAALSLQADPLWAPLGRPGTNTLGDFTKTPDFPAYPSGHATFGAVAFRLAAHFFAEKLARSIADVMNNVRFDFVSDEFNGTNKDPKGDIRVRHVRNFSLREAIVENALSRVYLGVHWRFDGLGAVAPDKLEGPIPDDPAVAQKLSDPIEKKMGGVPVGLVVAA